MASKPRPGIGQEALSLEFSGEQTAPTPHYFDLMSQAADAQARMDEARDYALSQREHTPLGIVLDITADQRRRTSAYAADRSAEDWAEFERAAETGQRWLPPRPQDPEAQPATYSPSPSRVNHLLEQGPVLGDDPTPIDSLARQAPIVPTPLDRSIASRHLPRLQWEAHERVNDLRDQTPPAGIINEGDPVPEFPVPEPPYQPQIHVRDSNSHWYRP